MAFYVYIYSLVIHVCVISFVLISSNPLSFISVNNNTHVNQSTNCLCTYVVKNPHISFNNKFHGTCISLFVSKIM